MLALGAVAVGAGCAAPLGMSRSAPLRISEVEQAGDARRRASTGLVVEGLDAELASRRERALSRYADAIRTDPGNPFAYLALARFYADARDAERALENLERAQSLLDAEQPYDRSVEPHLRGLRGWSLAVAGQRASAEPLLAEARRLAPVVWDDARLEARELR
ncbi:MAG TPA: hypothetical protein VEC18_06055 [Myxococcota bacterium]|nr:hypothetical protein [Myxococcota bacterium]